MKRLDKTAFEYRDDVFASAFFDELLTPTSFAAKFGEGPDVKPASLFAALAPELTDPTRLSEDAMLFYRELMERVETAGFLNTLVGGMSDGEAEVATEAGMNRAMGVVSHMVTARLLTAQKEAEDAGKALSDMYSQLDTSVLDNIGIDGNLISAPDAFSNLRGVNTHNQNKRIAEEKVAFLVGDDTGNSDGQRPSGYLIADYATDVDFLNKVISAYSDAFYQPYGDPSDPTFRLELETGLALLEDWRTNLANVSDNMDHYTHAFTSGILRTPSGEASLRLSDGDTINYFNVNEYIVSGSQILDLKTNELISGDEYRQKYLNDLNRLDVVQNSSTRLNDWFQENLNIDMAPLIGAYQYEVDQFFDGVTFGNGAAKIVDKAAVRNAMHAGLEADNGAGRALAYAGWQTYLAEALQAVDPNDPSTKFPWYTADQFDLQKQELVFKFAPFLGIQGGEGIADVRLDLAVARQDFTASYIMASDDARPLYELQLAVV